MKARRKGPRRGRWRSLPALPLIADVDELRADHERLTRQGYLLRQNARCYIAIKGTVTLRLVWRKRRGGATQTHEITLRFPPDAAVATRSNRGGIPALQLPQDRNAS